MLPTVHAKSQLALFGDVKHQDLSVGLTEAYDKRELRRYLHGRSHRAVNVDVLKAFYDAGGKVVATTCLPSKSAEIGHDKDVVEAVNQMFGAEPRTPSPDKSFTKQTNAAGGAGYFVPALNGLAAAIDDALPVPDVRFAEHGPVVDQRKGMLSYLHKVKDGRNVYFVANSTDNPVDTEMTVRGKMTLQRWNPYDGTISAVEGVPIVEGGVPCTRLRLTLAPVDSVFLVESK